MNPNEFRGPYDVVVIGGGLAGLSAAVAAARRGVTVALVQGRPVLGGSSSTEIRVPPRGAGYHNPWAHETGIILELLLEERARNHEKAGYGMANASWDLVQYEAVKKEANLELFLNTVVIDVQCDDGRRIRSVTGVQSGSERVIQFTGSFFFDCTGDGFVGMKAGAPWTAGQEPHAKYGEPLAPEKDQPGWRLGSSLIFHARDVGRPVGFTPPAWAIPYPEEASLQQRPHKNIEGGYWWIEIGAPFDKERGIVDDDLYDELLAHLLGIWDHIKNHCKDREKAQNYALEWVSSTPGKRESRRFIGDHVMTENEIRSRTLYPDRVAYGGWIVDDHTQGGITVLEKAPSFDKANVDRSRCLVVPYSVPLSSMVVSDVPNLFLAGRLMSASRLAFNSLRVQSTLSACGQAAGTAAAYCVSHDAVPGRFTAKDVDAIQQDLLSQDCYIPGVRNTDPHDLARTAHVTASSAALYRPRLGEGSRHLSAPTAQLVPVSEDRIDRACFYLENSADRAVSATATLYPALDIWDLEVLNGKPAKQVAVEVPPRFEGWFSVHMDHLVESPGWFWLMLEGSEDLTWREQSEAPPGLSYVDQRRRRWWFGSSVLGAWTALAADVYPQSRPFEPESVNNGVARAEKWPNLWMSDPGHPLPQWLQLELREPSDVSSIQMTFDTNLSRSYEHTPGLFRSPECVRDCLIELRNGDNWKAVGRITDNYHRQATVEFPAERAEAVRIQVLRTNGVPEARIFEVRIY